MQNQADSKGASQQAAFGSIYRAVGIGCFRKMSADISIENGLYVGYTLGINRLVPV
jgi:carbohydrate-binding DOMON domain-containing protein